MNDFSAREEALTPVVESFLGRFRRGERPSIEEYASRHPELADAIREVLPALVAVEQDLTVDRGEMPGQARVRGLPDQLGDYRILREIGRGGMGVVYEAVQQSLGRHVALKVLPWTLLAPNGTERFRSEARVAARLHHTNIVPVFGVGEDGGTHYFAMQFIQGQGLDQVIEELRRLQARSGTVPADISTVAFRPLQARSRGSSPDAMASTGDAFATLVLPGDSGPEESPSPPPESLSPSLFGDRGSIGSHDRVYFDAVARIILQVAEALAYAHAQGILHRDIKPSNILLDSRGTAWVTDFGLAKSDEDAGLTRTGDVVGTIRYMAPERFDGISDPRSDVYGLGATLYELLTLRPLFEDVTRPRLVDQVLRREPVRPRLIDPRIPRDLEVICLKCVAKERAGRYDSAERLAQELRRYLNGQTIQARQIGSFERSWRWCARNPAVSGLLAALLTSLVFGLVGVSYQWWQARLERQDAENEAARANLSARLAETSARKEKAARDSEAAARLDAQRVAARTALAQGRSRADQGAVAQGMHWMVAALRQTPTGDRDFERLVRLNLAAYGQFLARGSDLLPDTPPIVAAGFSADGSRVATVRLVDAARGSLECSVRDASAAGPPLRTIPVGWGHTLSPDGRTVAYVDGTGPIVYRDVVTGQASLTPPPSPISFPQGLTYSPDGRSIVEFGATGPADKSPGLVRILDAATGRAIGTPIPFATRVIQVLFRPDGRAIAVVSRGETLSLWTLQPDRRELLRTPLNGTIGHSPVAIEPGGRWIVAWSLAGQGAGLRFWDATSGQPLDRRIDLGESFTPWLSYSPDGQLLQVAEPGGLVRLFDASTDRPLSYPFVRIPGGLRTAFDETGRALLATPAGNPGQARRIAIPEGMEAATGPAGVDDPRSRSQARPVATVADQSQGASHMFAWNPARDRLVTTGKTVRILDPETGEAVGPPIRSRWQTPGPVAISRDGATMAHVSNNTTGDMPGTIDCLVEVRNVATGRLVGPPIYPRNTVIALDFSPDGRSIATGDFSDLVQVWDTARGAPIGPPILQENIVWSIAYSPDGSRLAVGTNEQRAEGHAGVRIWDLAARRPVGPVARHRPAGDVLSLLWSRDGSRVASFSRKSGEIMLVDGRDGACLARASDFGAPPHIMIGSPDGKMLLVGTTEGTVEMRDAADLKRSGPAMLPPDTLLIRRRVDALAISPDGLTVAAGHIDGTIRLWDVSTRQPIGPTLSHDRSVFSLAFRKGGRTLTATSIDGEVRHWPVPGPWEGPADLLALQLEVETGLGLGPSQDVSVLPPDVLRRKSRELSESGPTTANAIPDDDLGRHEGDARRAERRAQWFAARFHLDRLISARPDDGRYRVRRALGLAAEGQADEARAELSRALQAGPREACLDLLVQRAHDAREAGRLDLAAWAIDATLTARPDDWRLHADRAEVCERLGDADGRDRERRLAADLGADALYLVQLARRLSLEGRPGQAREFLERVTDRVDERLSLHILLTTTHDLTRLGSLERAGKLTARIAAVAPVDTLDVIYLRAMAAVARRDRAGYRYECARALKHVNAGASPELANAVAWICVLGPDASDDPDRIVKLAGDAAAKVPADLRPTVLNTLGAALIRSGRPSEAVRPIREGIRLRGGPPLLQDRLFLAIAGESPSDNAATLREPAPSDRSELPLWDTLEIEILRREARQAILDRAFPNDPFAASR